MAAGDGIFAARARDARAVEIVAGRVRNPIFIFISSEARDFSSILRSRSNDKSGSSNSSRYSVGTGEKFRYIKADRVVPSPWPSPW